MFCPECNSEYRPGFTECASCHVPLVEALEAPQACSRDGEGHVDPDDWAVAYDAPLAQRAWLSGEPPPDVAFAGILFLETVLQDNGIECMFYPTRPFFGVSAGHGSSIPQLLVRQRDLEAVRMLIQEALESEPAPEEDWTSVAPETDDLGESGVPEQTQCPHCGEPYDRSDYDPDALPWLCAMCRQAIRG